MYTKLGMDLDRLRKIKCFIKANNAEFVPIIFDTKDLDGVPVHDRTGKYYGLESYGRLFSPFLLPDSVKKILYLDVDMICTGDIAELYDINFDGNLWCACPDLGIKQQDLERLSLSNDFKYVNSGVLLINAEEIRKKYNQEMIKDLIIENSSLLVYPDQDFLNKVFGDNIKRINVKYNTTPKDNGFKDLKEKPLIIHFAGKRRPWSDDVSGIELGFMQEYYNVLKQQPDKKDFLIRLKKEHEKKGYWNRPYDCFEYNSK